MDLLIFIILQVRSIQGSADSFDKGNLDYFQGMIELAAGQNNSTFGNGTSGNDTFIDLTPLPFDNVTEATTGKFMSHVLCRMFYAFPLAIDRSQIKTR